MDAHTSAADAAPETGPVPSDDAPAQAQPPNAMSGLLTEAQSAVSSSANVLRDVRERYRVAHLEDVERWEQLKSQLTDRNGGTPSDVRRDEAMAAGAVGTERTRLGRFDLAIKSLENAWLFLDPDDSSLVNDPDEATSFADVQMRIVEAQEAERNRLAREVHDGPAQALSNAIFQLEIVDRLLDRDEQLARRELLGLRDMLTRELRGVRAYLSQLRPPLLADLGLVGAIRDAADQIESVLGVPVTAELDEAIDGLPEPVEIVILRVIQEALQNVRKHAKPAAVRVHVARDDMAWVAEVRDDGQGFDPDDVHGGGRRHFGLQFMRERADLIGARFEVRSRPELGTVVRLVIPIATEEST